MNTSQSKTKYRDQEPEKIRYFIPNQILLHAEHPADPVFVQSQLIEALYNFLRDQDLKSLNVQFSPPAGERIITFSNQAAAFSIVPMRFSQTGKDPNEVDYDLTAVVISRLYEVFPRGGDGIRLGDGILLHSAAPNWLVSGAAHQIGTGGPSNKPEKAELRPGSMPIFVLKDFPDDLPAEGARGEGMHVAILDTAPCMRDLWWAYYYWRDTHPLINSLLKPGGPINVYPASRDDIEMTADFGLAAHRYQMRDHGLFAAGIIHSIAPDATLHLYEVLNPYGVGCVETIVRGLYRAITNPNIQRPLVINCSLVLNLPRVQHPTTDLPDELLAVSNDAEFQKMMVGSIEAIVSHLSSDQDQIAIVAAAGNDGVDCHNQPVAGGHPQTRYPAAFEKVVGVGALPRNPTPTAAGKFNKTSYSNRSDEIPEYGVATMGGEAGIDKGVLGVYISNFPVRTAEPSRNCKFNEGDFRYENNDSGWAWWSGTSFAAPIVSGVLTAWWGNNTGKAGNQAIAILNGLTNSGDNGEKVLLVNQELP